MQLPTQRIRANEREIHLDGMTRPGIWKKSLISLVFLYFCKTNTLSCVTKGWNARLRISNETTIGCHASIQPETLTCTVPNEESCALPSSFFVPAFLRPSEKIGAQEVSKILLFSVPRNTAGNIPGECSTNKVLVICSGKSGLRASKSTPRLAVTGEIGRWNRNVIVLVSDSYFINNRSQKTYTCNNH